MQTSDFTDNRWGNLAPISGNCWAFAPNPLPAPIEPTWPLTARLSEADRAVSELAGCARNLPNPHLLIRPFMRREAVLSSRIEGTQASLSDMFFFEAAESPSYLTKSSSRPDVREVLNYVRALDYGLKRLKEIPLCLRLIRELHGRLMEGVRGERQTPGQFRRTQNWIGPPGCPLAEADFVPPPVPEMREALNRLERYMHQPSPLPPLIRFASIHYQFEAIHPFVDGNGRIGRLLLSLLFCHEGLLPQPLLYLSAFFEKRREDYYRMLLEVSQRGRWKEWIDFFLVGVATQARDAIRRSGQLLDLWQSYRRTAQSARASALLLRLIDGLFESPVVSIPGAARQLGVTYRSAAKYIEKLQASGILHEATGRKRRRLYVAREILSILEAPEQM